jgi:hypothetical protein
MAYTMTVVAIDGAVYELPADVVTCDAPPQLALAGPLLPLAFRSPRDAFYVRGDRWPELAGKALHVNGRAPLRHAAPTARSSQIGRGPPATHHRASIQHTPR